jgi:hypothetical protein
MAGLDLRPRGARGLFLAGLGICLWLLVSGWGRLVSGISDGSFGDDVRIEVSGVPENLAHDITFWFPMEGRDFEFMRFGSDLRWRMNGWIPAVRMSATPAAIRSIKEIRFTTGHRLVRYTQKDISGWKTVEGPPGVMPVSPETVTSLDIPLARYGPIGMINWQREGSASSVILPSLLWLPVILLILAGFRIAVRSRGFLDSLGNALGISGNGRTGTQRGSGWLVAGFAVVILCLGLAEIQQPFYFTQDDNYSQFLPVILTSCRSVLAGTWPWWNPYQLLGAPTMTLGTYSLTYPFTYAAWFIARYLLLNEYLTIEVFAIGHILAGYWATALFLRRLSLRPALVAMGASSFVLSGFALVLGRSWYYMLPVLVWAPLLAYAVETLPSAPSAWRWIAPTGVVIGIFFHAGNAQMWAYALIFFVLAVGLSWLGGRVNAGRALWSLPALLAGAGIALPLLLLQMQETANIKRYGGRGSPIGSGTLQMMLPLGKLLPVAEMWAGFQRSFRGEMFFIGLPFVAAILFGAWALFSLGILYRQNSSLRKAMVGSNIWLICAVVAWIFALGRPGVLWGVTASLPVFEKFNVPGKFLGYIALFAVSGGGLIVNRVLRPDSRIMRALPVFVFGCLFIHVSLARQGFYNFGHRPYPALSAEMRAILAEAPVGRVLTIGPDRSPNQSYVTSLRNNFASVAGIPAVEGYDPLVDTRPEDQRASGHLDADPQQGARVWGVRWVLVWEPGFGWNFSEDKNAWFMEVTAPNQQHRFFALRPALRLRVRDENVALYELSGASPMAFSGVDSSLPVRFDGNGASVDVRSVREGTPVTLNVMGRRWMRLTADGADVRWFPDEFGRVRFRAPGRASSVRLAYTPPWQKAVIEGLILILASIGLTAILILAGRARMPFRAPKRVPVPAHA